MGTLIFKLKSLLYKRIGDDVVIYVYDIPDHVQFTVTVHDIETVTDRIEYPATSWAHPGKRIYIEIGATSKYDGPHYCLNNSGSCASFRFDWPYLITLDQQHLGASDVNLQCENCDSTHGIRIDHISDNYLTVTGTSDRFVYEISSEVLKYQSNYIQEAAPGTAIAEKSFR